MAQWSPSTCRGRQCILEFVPGHQGLVSIVRLCPHHQNMRAGLPNDSALWDRILASNRVKTIVTSEAGLEFAIDADLIVRDDTIPAPVRTYTIDDQDRIVVTTGLNAARRRRLQDIIDARVGLGLVIIQ